MDITGSHESAAEFEIIVSGLLANFAPSVSEDATNSQGSTVYPDDVFDKVAKYLVQAGKQPWSLRPRTYIVLRLINRLDCMPAFILDGLFDIAFPYAYNRLPASLSPGTRNAFLEQQSVVLSKAGDLEMENGRHRHFPGTAESNFIVVKQLGSGYFGVVDHVRSKLSLEEYARKRTVRARTFSKDKKALKVFENELHNLKRLSHRHLVKYVGSYTDPHYIGLLMSPVADCDLRVFLTQPNFPHNLISCLRSFFGCLCSAVSYLHSQQCRHKDLKPGNILVKGNVILITDFGTSRNWSDKSKGTTTGESGPYTPGYAAPEVVAWEARNESSDIWSLACVYLDILTVLKGETLRSKDTFFDENGNGGKNPRVNPYGLALWLAKLANASDEDNQPISWIQQMLQVGPKDRVSSVGLLDAILGHADQHIYYGHCCADHEEETSSCNSSEICDDDSAIIAADESTNATSIASEADPMKSSSLNVRTPGSAPSTIPSSIYPHNTSGSQGDLNAYPSSSTRTISEHSTSHSAPMISSATTGERIDEWASPRSEMLNLHSSNPFRPRPAASPAKRRPVPNIPSQEALDRTISPKNPFWASLDNIPAAAEDVSGSRDSFIARAWPTHHQIAHTTTPASIPEETLPSTTSNQRHWRDASGSAGPSANKPIVVPRHSIPHMPFEERETSQVQHQQAELKKSNLQLATEGSVQGYPPVGNPFNALGGADSQSHPNKADFANDVYLLCDAAAKGDIPALLKYSFAGKNLKEGTLGKLAFRSAAENNQRIIMQLLLDLGCPVFSQDIVEHIIPMVDSLELTIDHRNPVHFSVAEETERIRTKQIGEQHEDFLQRCAEGLDEYLLPPGAQTIRMTEGGQKNLAPSSIEVQKNDLPKIKNRPVIGPWDPSGFHWDLKIIPDPAAMHKAIHSGYYYEVINCINQGYDVNLRDEDDQSPLDVAISVGLISIIDLLIQYGANPRSIDSRGRDAYAKAQYRFSNNELKEVNYALDRYMSWDIHPMQHQNQLQFPPTVQIPWANFLEGERTGYGRLHMANEWSYALMNPYPQQIFEVPDTSIQRPLRFQKPQTRERSTPNIIRKFLDWELW